MAISSQNAILNKYSPPYCIKDPIDGQVLVYDSNDKVWKNGYAEAEGAVSFIGLEDTPTTYAGAASGIVVVNDDEDALVFTSAIDGGFYGDESPASSTYYISYTGTEITTFIQLEDTPTTYTGQAGKLVQVDSDEDAVIFVDLDGGTY